MFVFFFLALELDDYSHRGLLDGVYQWFLQSKSEIKGLFQGLYQSKNPEFPVTQPGRFSRIKNGFIVFYHYKTMEKRFREMVQGLPNQKFTKNGTQIFKISGNSTSVHFGNVQVFLLHYTALKTT